jgi:hypothetical protein
MAALLTSYSALNFIPSPGPPEYYVNQDVERMRPHLYYIYNAVRLLFVQSKQFSVYVEKSMQ